MLSTHEIRRERKHYVSSTQILQETLSDILLTETSLR